MIMKTVNRGVGLSSGVWQFDEFEFCNCLMGWATITYDCTWRKLRPDEVAEGDNGKPYELRLSNPVVKDLRLEDGVTIGSDDPEVLSGVLDFMHEMLIEAWRDAEDHVLEHEMGLL